MSNEGENQEIKNVKYTTENNPLECQGYHELLQLAQFALVFYLLSRGYDVFRRRKTQSPGELLTSRWGNFFLDATHACSNILNLAGGRFTATFAGRLFFSLVELSSMLVLGQKGRQAYLAA